MVGKKMHVQSEIYDCECEVYDRECPRSRLRVSKHVSGIRIQGTIGHFSRSLELRRIGDDSFTTSYIIIRFIPFLPLL